MSKKYSTTIKYQDIETPTTVEEFRENLRKYYCVIDNEQLYVMDEWNIMVDELNSLDSLYSMTKQNPPSIIPLVEYDGKDVRNYMDENGLYNSSWGFFENTDKYKMIPSGSDLLGWNPMWVKIDNQIVREFFVKTLGEFSGYIN
ncbi:MAG: hypothetical protein H8D80_00390 [Proteobacteria bacterium]|nr:hypothetical protein [Pseudomonadota bacterium]